MATLNLDDIQLELGQVRTITRDSGKVVDSIELLLGNKTKAEMKINSELNILQFVVKDTDFDSIPKLEALINKETLRDFIIGLKNLYNSLDENSV